MNPPPSPRPAALLLQHKTAVIYGASGAVGSAIARAFAREGALVHLTGRNRPALDNLAAEIAQAGGRAEAALVDGLSEAAIEDHLDRVAPPGSGIDISFNAIGIAGTRVAAEGMQGVPLTEIRLESFTTPIDTYTRTNFLTGRAAVRRMLRAGRPGVLLLHTPEPARIGGPLLGGMAPAWAALEALTRSFSWEFAAHGIRTVGLRTTGMPETHTIAAVFGIHAKVLGLPWDQVRKFMESTTHARRSSTLEEFANVAAFLASDRARGMTGTVANLTLGKAAD